MNTALRIPASNGNGPGCRLWQFSLWFFLSVAFGPQLAGQEDPAAAGGDGAVRGKPAPAAEAGVVTGEFWALLIGINGYEHMPPLNYCARDMEVLAEALEQNCGYATENIRLLCDSEGGQAPTRNNILLALSGFLQQAAAEDTVLIAFAGHGGTVPRQSSTDSGQHAGDCCGWRGRSCRFGQPEPRRRRGIRVDAPIRDDGQ